MIHLVVPSVKYKKSFLRALRESHAKKVSLDINEAALKKDFAGYCRGLRDQALGRNLPKGYVSATVLWLVDGRKYIGRVSIRHRLTKKLRLVGGHIGYDIRPSVWRKGYGSKILAKALPWAEKNGLKKVLLTCDSTNVASRKIIEKNGGVFENLVKNPETGLYKLRFWIDLSK